MPPEQLLPEDLRMNTQWWLTEDTNEDFSYAPDHPWHLEIWAIEIPPAIRSLIDAEDKPHLKDAEWGLTMNPAIARACIKAPEWAVHRLKLSAEPRDMDVARSIAFNQIRKHYTTYSVENNQVFASAGESSAPTIFGDWVEIHFMLCTENLLRSTIYDDRVRSHLQRMSPIAANVVTAFQTGEPYTGDWSNENERLIFQAQSWMFKRKQQHGAPIQSSSQVEPDIQAASSSADGQHLRNIGSLLN
ncbi:unnamed protein product [Periconia digitata]|uniref:Uncharacterized protein n=1 Tax=Periconia digitata TaxID=1303443 RepID=A0A9W4U880_9PLEO|nr:unnamed protein product [Periconia digitata]